MDNHVAIPKPAVKFLKREEEAVREETRLGLEYLKPILMIPPKDRTPDQVQTLTDHTRHIKFFAELAANEGTEAHQQCVQYIAYESVPRGVFLFHSGDEGSKFYIILNGSVAVLAPIRRRDGKPDYSLLVVLRGGDSFGELALISNKPRAASILVREDSSFAVLERSDYLRLLSKIQDNVLSHKVELLQNHPVFSSWNKNALQRLSYFFKVLNFKRKQILFHAGQNSTHVYLIKSGEFRLCKAIEASVPRKSHLAEVTLLGKGEMIGDQEVINGAAYTYTCVCDSAHGEVMQITKEDFLKRIVTDESVGCFLGLGRMKETYRSGRLKQISSLEQKQHPAFRMIRTKAKLGADNGGQDFAKNVLEADVRRRWNLPHKRGGSLALEKALSEQWLKLPMQSTAVSPRMSFASSPVPTPSKRESHRTWVELVKRKYFHRRTKTSILTDALSSWDSSMPQWTVTSMSSQGFRDKDQQV